MPRDPEKARARKDRYREKKRQERIAAGLPVGKGHGRHVGGSEHHWFKGSVVNPRGYLTVNVGKAHPLSNAAGMALVHRLVWATAHPYDTPLGTDVIHHINGDKLDNRLDNLQRLTRAEHTAMHASDMLTKRNGGTNPPLDGVVYDARLEAPDE